MIEILKTFETLGIAVGEYGESFLGNTRHVSFLMMVLTDCNQGICLTDQSPEKAGIALVRMTMLDEKNTMDTIAGLQYGDLIRVVGFVCANEEDGGYLFYGTNIERQD